MRGTPEAIGSEIRRRARALPVALKASEKRTLREGRKLAVSFSSGPFSSAMLARLGHPYAQIGPRRSPPPAPPFVINKQSGDFLAHWKQIQLGWGGGRLRSILFNDSRHAHFLDAGTKRMISRPIRQVVTSYMLRSRRKSLEAALRKALKT